MLWLRSVVSVKSLRTSSLTFFFFCPLSWVEQEGSLIGRLPFFPDKWGNERENTGSIVPHPPHRAELGACRTRRQHLPLLCFLTKQTWARPVFPWKRSCLAVPLMQCACLWGSGAQREDRAALRSMSVQAGFVNGPFIFLHCACKRTVKLSPAYGTYTLIAP